MRKEDTMEKLMTGQEAANLLGVTPRTLLELRKRGELNAVRVGNRIRFQPSELERYIEANTEKQARKEWNPRRFTYVPGMKVV